MKVLCTFNLDPVSRGLTRQKEKDAIKSERNNASMVNYNVRSGDRIFFVKPWNRMQLSIMRNYLQNTRLLKLKSLIWKEWKRVLRFLMSKSRG